MGDSKGIPVVVKKHVKGYFPDRYLSDFIEFLGLHSDLIEIITYDDLPWEGDEDYKGNYRHEFSNWRRQIKTQERDPDKIYVLLQHDVDLAPESTMALLRAEQRCGTPSNVMIFTHRVFGKHLRKTGELAYLQYEIDHSYLRELQKKEGFVVGYHSNAYERALFDAGRAYEIFESDLNALSEIYDEMKYFSPHGGVGDKKGKTNNSLELTPSMAKSIRWVANGHTVRFNGSYSDGGINGFNPKPEDRDLKDFVKSWKKGRRYRVITHPQYYRKTWDLAPRLDGTPWYDQLLKFYSGDGVGSVWDDLNLKG